MIILHGIIGSPWIMCHTSLANDWHWDCQPGMPKRHGMRHELLEELGERTNPSCLTGIDNSESILFGIRESGWDDWIYTESWNSCRWEAIPNKVFNHPTHLLEGRPWHGMEQDRLMSRLHCGLNTHTLSTSLERRQNSQVKGKFVYSWKIRFEDKPRVDEDLSPSYYEDHLRIISLFREYERHTIAQIEERCVWELESD
ncbi:hypothetical protein Tco_0724771 [Tanacetum coccineum]|uniref:Uncharacterized protein n=1 Tax=Tanacetum coccineum TaxID=301880 RepID=A0ABQ4YDA0_9ASTR